MGIGVAGAGTIAGDYADDNAVKRPGKCSVHLITHQLAIRAPMEPEPKFLHSAGVVHTIGDHMVHRPVVAIRAAQRK